MEIPKVSENLKPENIIKEIEDIGNRINNIPFVSLYKELKKEIGKEPLDIVDSLVSSFRNEIQSNINKPYILIYFLSALILETSSTLEKQERLILSSVIVGLISSNILDKLYNNSEELKIIVEKINQLERDEYIPDESVDNYGSDDDYGKDEE